MLTMMKWLRPFWKRTPWLPKNKWLMDFCIPCRRGLLSIEAHLGPTPLLQIWGATNTRHIRNCSPLLAGFAVSVRRNVSGGNPGKIRGRNLAAGMTCLTTLHSTLCVSPNWSLSLPRKPISRSLREFFHAQHPCLWDPKLPNSKKACRDCSKATRGSGKWSWEFWLFATSSSLMIAPVILQVILTMKTAGMGLLVGQIGGIHCRSGAGMIPFQMRLKPGFRC